MVWFKIWRREVHVDIVRNKTFRQGTAGRNKFVFILDVIWRENGIVFRNGAASIGMKNGEEDFYRFQTSLYLVPQRRAWSQKLHFVGLSTEVSFCLWLPTRQSSFNGYTVLSGTRLVLPHIAGHSHHTTASPRIVLLCTDTCLHFH